MSPIVDLFLIFLADVVEPVLFVQEQLATGTAFQDVPFVRVTGVFDQFIIACEPLMAVFAFIFFVAQKPHCKGKRCRWL